MIAISIVTGVIGVVADAPLEPGRPARDARPARRSLPPPPAYVARVLHADAHGRGAVADLERHRRRPERRHEHCDLDRLERDDGARDDDRDDPARLGARALRVRADPRLRPAHAAGRRRAAADRDVDAGVARRHLEPRPGVALGLGDPARQDDGADGRARRPLRGRVAAARRPRGAPADDRPLGDGVDPDDLRGHAGRCRTGSAGSRSRTARTRSRSPTLVVVHDAADAAVLPGRLAARRRARRADARSRSSTASSSTSTSRSTSRSARTRATLAPAGDVAFDHVWFRYGDGRVDARGRRRSRCPPGRRRRSSARRVRARRRSATSPRGSTTSTRARHDRRRRRARPDVRVAARPGRRRLAGDLPLPRERAREPALREAGRDRRGDRGGGRGGAASTT